MSDSINALIAGQHNASVIDSLANPPQVNVLGSITRAAEAAQGVMRMRALQSQQAWGEALQQATDPKTGVVDYPTATRIAASDSRMPMGMAAATEGASARTGEQLTQSIARNSFVGNMALDGMRDPSDENWARIRAKAVASGLPPSGLAEIDRIIALPPEQRKIEAFKHASSRMDANYELAVGGYPVPQKTDVGSGLQGVTVTPPAPGVTGGVGTTGGFVPFGLTPQQWNAPIPDYKDPKNGQPAFKTYGQAMAEAGIPGPWVPAPASAPAAPGARAPAAAPAPASAPPAPGATAAPAPVPLGPRPDDKARWDASSALYARDLEGSTTYQQRIFPLTQVASILASGDVTTGQGADALNRAKSFLQTAATSMGWDAQTIQQAKYDEVAKYMQQYVNAQGMSARSDQALASAITGNPSSHLSTIANKEVVKPLLAVERMKQMALADFKASGGHGNDYTTFLNEWQNTHDPRAFLVDLLDKPAYMKMLNGMGRDERIRFDKTLKVVEANPGIMGQAVMPH